MENIFLLINLHPIVVSSTLLYLEKALSAFGITNGARDILSTPPAITKSISPDIMVRQATITASKPDPHNLFIVVAGIETGRPDSNVAIRATFLLSSPAWFAHPNITSSISLGSIFGFFLIKWLITSAARSSGLIEESEPPYLPIGVLTPSQINASAINLTYLRAR